MFPRRFLLVQNLDRDLQGCIEEVALAQVDALVAQNVVSRGVVEPEIDGVEIVDVVDCVAVVVSICIEIPAN